MASDGTKSKPPQARCLVDAGLESQVLLPSDPEYASFEESYFAANSRLGPACVVRPRYAQEVSVCLQALVQAGEKFAVRGGGHTSFPGANNIRNGVTIDLSLLNSVVYSQAGETVTFGAGLRWNDVNGELAKYDRAVAGGRVGVVGVSGFLLGGGATWLNARHGWGCDNVISYEVVLADGRIVTADRDSNEDLFRVLKGGSTNFGIVTKFVMTTIDCPRVWGGLSIIPLEAIPDAIDVTWKFTKNIRKYLDSNLFVMIGYTPQFKESIAAVPTVQTKGVSDDGSYDEWQKLPKTINTTRLTTMHDLGLEYSLVLEGGYYTTWSTLSFKNDKSIMMKAFELHNRLLEEMKAYIPDGDFWTQCVFIPLPTLYGENSTRAGGNVMGLERHPCDGILFLIEVMVRTPEQDSWVVEKVDALIGAVKQYASTIENGMLDWLYMNYAGKNQKVLESYGAENVRKMKDAAAKYDPDQVFQKLCPGGFKLSAVEG
ncbi:hypothetical protein F4778DRAFT_793303 [Xylariomycetidae sp. FL2044]|nr:hypothetical protein F4778DRAFT_793303 [Xylariomycetidae sp. FL2044]